MLKFFRLCVAAVFLFMAGNAFAAVPVDILRMDAHITISTEDRIQVVENILVDVPVSGANHGIYRDIPVNSRWRDKGRKNVELKVLNIRLDGQPLPVDDISENGNFLRIYLRDINAFLSAGVHQFLLQYEMTQQIGFFEDHDELTWNVTGSGWDGIEKSLCIVLAPEGANFINQKALLGLRGEQNSPVQIFAKEIDGRSALVFNALRPLRPGEDFTIAAAWPKGISKAPERMNPEDEIWFTLALFALFLAVLVWASFLWYRYGKDPKPGAVIPLFYPPQIPARLRAWAGGADKVKYISAAAVNYVWNKNALTSRGMAALFLSLAERGDCALEGDSSSTFVVRKLKESSPYPEEQDVESAMQEDLVLDKSGGAILLALTKICQSKLSLIYEDYSHWKSNILPIAASFLPAVAGLVFLLYCNLGAIYTWPEELFEYAFGIGFLIVYSASFMFAGLKLIRRKKFMAKCMGVVMLLCVSFLVLTGMWEAFPLSEISWLFSPLQIAFMAAILIVPALYAPVMDAPSVEAAKLQQEIAGLAMYIGAAEADRLNYANPPDKPLELYHRLLPYAVALGLEKAWGERFAEELAALEQSELAQQAGQGSNIQHCLVSMALLDTLIYQTNYCTTAYIAQTRASARSRGSSFGGFGGGGAGFGGGGGGGGAC